MASNWMGFVEVIRALNQLRCRRLRSLTFDWIWCEVENDSFLRASREIDQMEDGSIDSIEWFIVFYFIFLENV